MSDTLRREQVEEIGSWFLNPMIHDLSRDAIGKAMALVGNCHAQRERIKALEKENEQLKNQLATWKAMA